MRAGIENFPLRLNRVDRGERARRKVREKSKRRERERERECVSVRVRVRVRVSPASEVESPVLGLVSVSWQGPREGTTRGGLVRGAHPAAVDLPSWHQNLRQVQRKRERAGQSGKKRKFIRGK